MARPWEGPLGDPSDQSFPSESLITKPGQCALGSCLVFCAPWEGLEPARSPERHEVVKGLLRAPQKPIHCALAAGVWGVSGGRGCLGFSP